VKKLLPPLTNIIRTTPAMSLLYECINGIIQGGILGNADDSGTDEIATLCVNKLRGMVMIDGDPNREYTIVPSNLKHKLTRHSQIRCSTSVQQDRYNTSLSSIAAGGCDFGVY
jgi:AP-3 complex subunit delta-1